MLFVKSFADDKDRLTAISMDPSCENPKLNELKENILKHFRENKDSCGIVFAKTREMTVALMNWMNETDELKELNPHNLVGSNAPSQKSGMSMLADWREFCLLWRMDVAGFFLKKNSEKFLGKLTKKFVALYRKFRLETGICHLGYAPILWQ